MNLYVSLVIGVEFFHDQRRVSCSVLFKISKAVCGGAQDYDLFHFLFRELTISVLVTPTTTTTTMVKLN